MTLFWLQFRFFSTKMSGEEVKTSLEMTRETFFSRSLEPPQKKIVLDLIFQVSRRKKENNVFYTANKN